MKILITGGAGYIGSHTCKLLKNKNYKILVFDNFSSGSKKFVKWSKFIKGDVRNFKEINNVIKNFRPKAIIHFASCISVAESKIEPKKYFENNFIGTVNLLEAMKKNKVKNIIFSSTAALYGYPKSKTISETDETKPINPYGFSKLYAEQAIEKYSDQFDINYAILRYFNAAGADKDCEIGEDHSPETHLIPLLINAAINNKTLKVFGKNFNTVDGTGVRDYIHVEDLASAHYLALKKILNSKKSFKINLGTEKGYSVNQIIKMAEKIFKCKIKKKYFPRRPGDTAKLVSSSRKAKKILGWTAKKSQLSNILLTAYKWHYKIRKNKRTHLIK